MRRIVRLAVGLAAGAAAVTVYAQDPAATPEAAPTAQIATEPLLPATPVDTPTRRWRPHTATPSVTPTPTATDTATPAPPTPTATRPQATATSTAVPPTATPTHWTAGLSNATGAGMLPLAIGGAIALLGTLLGTALAGSGARAARRRGRRTMASAMLIELRRVDAVLRRLVALDNPASFPSLDHPIMEAALRDLTAFKTDTAARIAQFHGALRGIQQEIADYRDNPLRWAGRLSELHQLVKVRAAAACRAVPELMKALEKEGGTPPPQLAESSSAAASSPALPPPPFKSGDGDDWTL